MNSHHWRGRTCAPAHGNASARLSFAALAAGLALFAFTLLGLALTPTPAQAQEEKQGHVVVQFDAAAQVVRPFTFTDSLSGLDALQLSGLDVVTASTSFGPVVCSIAGVGCPAQDCFCNPNQYWAYTYWDGTAWQDYATGAGSSRISQPGAVEGWHWGAFGDAQAPAPPALAAADALAWLAARQDAAGGGYGGPGATVETLLAVAANSLPAEQWRRSAASPSLAAAALAVIPAYSQTGAAAAGKSAAGLAGAALCLPALTALPGDYYSPTLGTYSVQSGPNAWALLGALAAGEGAPPLAAASLREQALASGGWEWAPGWGADSNSTALALQALLGAGEPLTATAIVRGLAYLKSAQNSDGGFAYAPASGAANAANSTASGAAASDANSTAYAVQALIAAGEDVRSAAWQVNGKGPLDYLLSMQQADGSFAWQSGAGPSLLATQQVIPALLGRTYGAGRSSRLAACPALFLPSVQQ